MKRHVFPLSILRMMAPEAVDWQAGFATLLAPGEEVCIRHPGILSCPGSQAPSLMVTPHLQRSQYVLQLVASADLIQDMLAAVHWARLLSDNRHVCLQLTEHSVLSVVIRDRKDENAGGVNKMTDKRCSSRD